MAAKKASKRYALSAKNSSAFLMLTLLLVSALFLLIAFGPFRANNLGLLSKKQQNQQSEAATILPPGDGSKRTPPCRFRVGQDPVAYSYGDIDRDGYITSVDALYIKKIVAGTYTQKDSRQPYLFTVADVSLTSLRIANLKDVDSTDSLLVLRYVAGTTNTFPACNGSTGIVVIK